MATRWVRSAPFDLSLLAGPPLMAAAAVWAVPGLRSGGVPPWGWLLLVVGVDVAHVWSTLWRTYLDPAELARRPGLYAVVPVACWVAGALLYRAFGPLGFWRVLAYLAVYHFIRQQYGFLRLYQRLEGPPSGLDDALDRAALYGGMLYPLVYWHASLPRPFEWFVAGDFVALPGSLAAPAAWLYAAALSAWSLRQIWRARRGALHPGRLVVVLGTAAAWWTGIVACDSDLAFTVTNVLAHGVPYFGLMWLSTPRPPGRAAGLGPASWAAAFLLVPLAAAYLEEGVWDLLFWKEHAGLFLGLSGLDAPEPGAAAAAALAPLLALPQAAHYVLDAYLWRFDGSNPGLSEALFGVDPSGPVKGQSSDHA
ncbi:MAG: hypothetical protein HY928_03280 [Elusimicrobia bacterium]|nr:hypothetical protein [Elusimicrobiota bacterium]